MKLSVMGMQHMDICRRMVEHYDLPITPQEYSRLQRQHNISHMQEAELMPGNLESSIISSTKYWLINNISLLSNLLF